jgi:FtsH-binding integral membrane protein
MRQELERAREESSGSKAYLLGLYYFITGNYSLVVILFGLALIAFGALILTGQFAVGPLAAIEHQVFAGMFGVWGASLVVIGVAAYAVMWVNKIYAQISQEGEEESESDGDSGTEFDANI